MFFEIWGNSISHSPFYAVLIKISGYVGVHHKLFKLGECVGHSVTGTWIAWKQTVVKLTNKIKS